MARAPRSFTREKYRSLRRSLTVVQGKSIVGGGPGLCARKILNNGGIASAPLPIRYNPYVSLCWRIVNPLVIDAPQFATQYFCALPRQPSRSV
jgi:hypothetical protein